MFHRAAAILIAALLWVFPNIPVSADTIPGQFVLVVDLEIKPAQLAAFKVAIKEIGEIIVRIEPGCQAFSAVFEKEHPTRVRLRFTRTPKRSMLTCRRHSFRNLPR